MYTLLGCVCIEWVRFKLISRNGYEEMNFFIIRAMCVIATFIAT
jgi:hypothetical protein